MSWSTLTSSQEDREKKRKDKKEGKQPEQPPQPGPSGGPGGDGGGGGDGGDNRDDGYDDDDHDNHGGMLGGLNVPTDEELKRQAKIFGLGGKGPKMKVPESFTGKRDDVTRFVCQCRIYLETKKGEFTNEIGRAHV